MSGYNATGIASLVAVAAVVIILAIFMLPQSKNILRVFAPDSSSEEGPTTGSFYKNSHLNLSKFVIAPDPFDTFGNYRIQGGDGADDYRKSRIVEISSLTDGRHLVTQSEFLPQYQTDKLLKIGEITNDRSNSVATFNDTAWQEGEQQQTLRNKTSQIRNLTYYVKFECGTISGNEGPLRPGHYDTDIGILNKQNLGMKIQWSITANNSKNTNSIIMNIEPQGSSNIVCNDLRKVIGNDQKFVEGFVIINVPLEPGLLASLSHGTQILGRNTEDMANFIEVQAFYTANALDELPHTILMDKITFEVINDTSGKIPLEMVNKTLDITVPSNLNEISEPEMKVKDILTAKFGLSSQELADLQIAVKSVSGNLGTMIDDHAISLSTIMPQASS
ncbi:MAG TPA: hypothetical protein VJ695_02270 [Nitrososphaera sp.]|nr:hypothetical protein [Nitrososphaera sp.]